MKPLKATALVLTLIAPSAYADESSSCQSVLCLAGMVQGKDGGNECRGPIERYFTIVEKDGMGDFDPSKTADSRMSFLQGCKSENSGWKKVINDKFGGVRG